MSQVTCSNVSYNYKNSGGLCLTLRHILWGSPHTPIVGLLIILQVVIRHGLCTNSKH